MLFRIHKVLRRVTFAAVVAAATAALAGTTTSAQTGCFPEDFIAWAVNRGPTALFLTTPVDIHIERWSTEGEKDRFTRTLLDGGPDALLKALRQADPVGSIRTPLTFADEVIFAWQELHVDGGRRIILMTDRPMTVWQESMHVLGNEDLLTVLELRIASNGEGEGKVAIGSNIAVDESLGLVQLKDYAAEPVRLIYVRQKRITS
jgi:hypothetical protein